MKEAMSMSESNPSKEIILTNMLAERVRAGQPIYVAGQLDEVNARLHAATVNRLMVETVLPVTVIHTSN